VIEVLAEWGLQRLAESAALLVSEVVTNGVRHAGTGMRLAVRRVDATTVRIAVTDAAPGVNVRVGSSSADAEGGRGLFLVEQIAAGWGSMSDDRGKTVWFELRA